MNYRIILLALIAGILSCAGFATSAMAVLSCDDPRQSSSGAHIEETRQASAQTESVACTQAANNATAAVNAILSEYQMGCQMAGGSWQQTSVTTGIGGWNPSTCTKTAKADYICCYSAPQ